MGCGASTDIALSGTAVPRPRKDSLTDDSIAKEFRHKMTTGGDRRKSKEDYEEEQKRDVDGAGLPAPAADEPGTEGKEGVEEIDAPVSPRRNRKVSAARDPNDFEYMEILGSGSYGKVVRVRSKGAAPRAFAMKIMDKRQIRVMHGEKHLRRCRRERQWLLELTHYYNKQHPYLVKMKDDINTKHRMYLLLELARRGDLSSVAKKLRPATFPESAVKILAAELLLGLAYLREHRLIHRDIRMANILVTDDGHLVITDLGIAARGEGHTAKVGAVGYKAPEIMYKRKTGYGYAVDVWCAGLVIYTLLGGTHPFKELVEKWRKSNKEAAKPGDLDVKHISFPDDKFSEAAKDLLKKMLAENPEERIWSTTPTPTATKKTSNMEKLADKSEPKAESIASSKDDVPEAIPEDKAVEEVVVAEDAKSESPGPEEVDIPPSPRGKADDDEESWPMPCKEILEHPFFEGVDWDAVSKKKVPGPITAELVPIPSLDPAETPKFKNHLEVLDEFNKKDPSFLIAEVFA